MAEGDHEARSPEELARIITKAQDELSAIWGSSKAARSADGVYAVVRRLFSKVGFDQNATADGLLSRDEAPKKGTLPSGHA